MKFMGSFAIWVVVVLSYVISLLSIYFILSSQYTLCCTRDYMGYNHTGAYIFRAIGLMTLVIAGPVAFFSTFILMPTPKSVSKKQEKTKESSIEESTNQEQKHSSKIN